MESTLQLKRRPTLPAANRDWLFAERLRYASATENESLAEEQQGPQRESAPYGADRGVAVGDLGRLGHVGQQRKRRSGAEHGRLG